MSARPDPDLDQIGREHGWDEETRELARFMRASSHAYSGAEPTPQFRQALRRRLMRRAWEEAARPSVPWYRRIPAGPSLAWTAATVGAMLIVLTAFIFVTGPGQPGPTRLTVQADLAGETSVATVRPIELKFSEPMDTRTVQVLIQPATQVDYQWQGNTLTIVPVNGLTPNTQYQVTVASGQTRSGQKVGKIQAATFITGPSPAPPPSPGPTNSPPPPAPIQSARIAPAGTPRFLWSADGTGLLVVGPTGQLQLFPLQGGTAQKLADGVTLVAVGSDGVAWVTSSGVTYKTTTIGGAQPLAIGFRNGALLLATASEVDTADLKRVTGFKETADAVDFAPTGDRVAYHGASGLHLVDLGSDKDTLVGPAPGLGDWAPDGRHYAYAIDGAVSVTDAAGSSTRLAELPGVTGISWSRGNQLLLATSSALYLAGYSDSGTTVPKKLQDGVFAQPDWSPAGNGAFSFRRSGEAWVARVQGAVAGGTITPVTPGAGQDDMVNAFMAARKNQLPDQAMSYLDSAGKDAFAKLNLVSSDPALARYYILLSQPGRVVVRLVLVRGTTQTAVDESLTIQSDASGRPWIHGVSEVPRASFGSGPEIASVVVNGGQVQVFFDSDLDPGTVAQPGAVAIRGVGTQATYDSRRKMVTLTVAGGLTAGAGYDLLVGTALQDVNQRHAVPYVLQLTGPAGS